MRVETVCKCLTEYESISALKTKLILHYEKDHSLFFSYLKPKTLKFKFKNFTRTLFQKLSWTEMTLGTISCGILCICGDSPFHGTSLCCWLGKNHGVIRLLRQ